MLDEREVGKEGCGVFWKKRRNEGGQKRRVEMGNRHCIGYKYFLEVENGRVIKQSEKNTSMIQNGENQRR